MLQKMKIVALGLVGAVMSFAVATASHAQLATSTALAAINTGVQTGGQTVLDVVGDNLPTVLTVFGILLALGVVLRLFRRNAR